MSIVPDRTHTVHTHADEWASWTDDDVWTTGPEPTEDDARWAAEHLNDDWHDLDGHPVIDDDTIAEEERYWAAEALRYAADPTDADLADLADLDDRAAEAAYLDSHELGLKTF